MTDEIAETEQSRRKFLKTSASLGVAATGVAASTGNAIAQQNGLTIDTSSLNVNQETGEVSGLVTLDNVNVDAIDDITVQNVTVELLTTEDDEVINVSKLIQTGGGDVVKVTLDDVVNDVSVLNDLNVSVDVSVLSDDGSQLQQASESVDL
ncbi:hypothetical protein BRC82_02770 [Halobacteriales archaeon QS_1_67_19]|nr:MAG: hypothetical protein BRC82_02770 [Halobacteriales archaeon QS_1_67_19]